MKTRKIDSSTYQHLATGYFILRVENPMFGTEWQLHDRDFGQVHDSWMQTYGLKRDAVAAADELAKQEG